MRHHDPKGGARLDLLQELTSRWVLGETIRPDQKTRPDPDEATRSDPNQEEEPRAGGPRPDPMQEARPDPNAKADPIR